MTVLFNPTVPIQSPIPCGCLRPGHSVVVHGEPFDRANEFTINLTDQSTWRCVFGFEVQFDENRTVCDCDYQSTYESGQINSIPFQRGQFFYVEIKCVHDRYMVAVNGRHHCDFQHRVTPSEADAFEIRGDVRLLAVEFKTSEPNSNLPPFLVHRFHAANPSVPYISFIKGQLTNGQEIQIYGRVKPQAKRFSINLQQGDRISLDTSIALHISPRFESRHRVIVVNSRGDRWGEEKRIEGSKNPLRPDGNFLLSILQRLNHFDISVNGSLAAEFKHRPLTDVADSLFIEGDVVIERILVF